MSEIFPKDDNTIGWDDESIGQKLPSYQPQILKAIDRLFVLSPVKKKKVHYIDGVGIVVCNGGKCCEVDKDPPKDRLGVVAFHYDTDRDGNLSKDANGEPIVRGELTCIVMTDKMYARFRSANQRQMADSDGKENLNTVDTMISVDDDHKKKWKQWTITLSRRSYYLAWAKKKDDNPEIAKELGKHKLKMKKLWEQLDRELGKELTDEELAAKLAQGGESINPQDLPDVGDPTDALGGLE